MLATTPPSLAVLPDPPAPPTPLGLIAGGGRLPILVARGMRDAGHPVRAVGLTGQYDPELAEYCESVREAPVLRLAAWSSALRSMGAHHAVMVGRVDKASLMYSWRAIVRNRPDMRVFKAWMRSRHDRRSNRLLTYVADELARDGIHLIDSTTHIPEHMADEGPMTRHTLTARQRSDMELGWPILRELLRLDIGQSLAVKDGDVIAVEAVEGTDRMIERAGALCRKQGWTLMKAARAGHDRRADVPTIGVRTIEHLHAHGGRAIVVAAGDVIIIDKPDTIARADELGVAIHGVSPA
ncbi:MAG: UDP-2,3-diacylglucosamine diphosphatase LpxI [Phycisphaerales bacterium]